MLLRLVALLATARAQTPRRVHGFDVRTKAGHAFKCLDVFIAPGRAVELERARADRSDAPAAPDPGPGARGARHAAADAREAYGPLGAGRGETLRRRVQALL